jgi:hypothetical protein
MDRINGMGPFRGRRTPNHFSKTALVERYNDNNFLLKLPREIALELEWRCENVTASCKLPAIDAIIYSSPLNSSPQRFKHLLPSPIMKARLDSNTNPVRASSGEFLTSCKTPTFLPSYRLS